MGLCCIASGATSTSCPAYPPPTNGAVSSAASTPVGQSVVISCNLGYSIDSTSGPVTPACIAFPPDRAAANRTAAEINGYQRGATCEPIFCGRFPSPANGRVEPETAFYGQRINIVCDPGFRAVGLPGSSETPLCQADGSFEMGKSCQRIQLDCLSSGQCVRMNVIFGVASDCA